jgi:predicted neuraminidase
VPDSLGAVHMNPIAPQQGVAPAFYRDRFSQAVQRSLSRDGGLSWSAPEPTDLPNNNSSIQAIRLVDGRVAMVLNPINAAMSEQRRDSLYDEIEAEAVAGTGGAVWGVPRAPMALAISEDNGARFPQRWVLDGGGQQGVVLSFDLARPLGGSAHRLYLPPPGDQISAGQAASLSRLR